MRIAPTGHGLRLILDYDEAQMLDQLVNQLIELLQSHSGTTLDPDPLFASLEVGGTDHRPDDPALARLLPDAYEDDAESSEFRRVTEQGLLNRKLQDAIAVASALGSGNAPMPTIEVEIGVQDLPAWTRTLTALRIAIAARIGLERDEDHDVLARDEATRGTVIVFDWLAAILESALAVMAEGGPDDEGAETL